MTSESIITHVTPVGGNVFADLGFGPAEAAQLLAETDAIISAKLAEKKLLVVVEEELLDVIDVEPLPDYTLFLEFENGEKRQFDMKPLLSKKPFDVLRDFTLFAKAFVDYGTVCWPGEIDIAPETLYIRSMKL